MFSRFFVRRPVFAWVIAILIMLRGTGNPYPARRAVSRRRSAVDKNLCHLHWRVGTDSGKQRHPGH